MKYTSKNIYPPDKWTVCVLMLLLMLSGCLSRGPFKIPAHFRAALKEQDSQKRERLESYEEATVFRCYREAGDRVTIVQSVQAYSEPMLVLTELDGDRVYRVEVLYENETEGYGDYVVEDWFLRRLLLPTQEKLKIVKRRKEAENEVIAITGATITSASVVIAVNNSREIIGEVLNNETN